ncbi:MAG: class II aldolase/adducin family protein [Candidatus Lokiarchaeota archaeon]|nr:class II aldolase/adducin family protein [Candidatus Lokiarchaeota archaeon]
MVKEEELSFQVVKTAKAIYYKGLVEAWEGNVSIRNGIKKEFFITPSLNKYETLTKDKIVHMNFKGEVLNNENTPSSEAKMHSIIYNAREKVHCIIHTHSLYATLLSIVHKCIPIIIEEQIILLGGSIEISEFKTAHTEDIGKAALKALGKKNAALLANHGAIVCGKTVKHTLKFAEFVEKLAKIYWGALQIGKPHILEEKDYNKFKKDFNNIFSC